MRKYKDIERTYKCKELVSKTCDICKEEYLPQEENEDIHQVTHYWDRDKDGHEWEVDYCIKCLKQWLKTFARNRETEDWSNRDY